MLMSATKDKDGSYGGIRRVESLGGEEVEIKETGAQAKDGGGEDSVYEGIHWMRLFNVGAN